MMLYKTKSRKTALLKYGLAAPLFASMVIFSSATIARQENKAMEKVTAVMPEVIKTVAGNMNLTQQDKTNEQIDPDKSSLTTRHELNEINTEPVHEETNLPTVNPEGEGSVARDSSIYSVSKIDTMPSFPGGMGAFYKWFGRNYKFSKEARDAGVKGRLTVTFVVEKDGALNDIKVLRDLKYGTGEEAKRVLTTSPKWKPGSQNGKPVRVQYTLPLMLNQETNKKEPEDKKGSTTPGQTNNPVFRAGVNPVILIDGKRFQKDIPSNFNFGSATEAEYAELLGIKSSDIRSIAVTKSQDGSTGGTLSITTKDGVLQEEVVLEKSDVSKVLSVRINGSNVKEKPLYLLDGKEITTKQFSKISPANIEEISILKDKSTSVYGEKGKNGVIIITSKK